MKKTILLFLFLISFFESYSQQSKPKNWTLNGYLKYMNSIYIMEQAQNDLIGTNLFHNRLNLKWFPTNSLKFDLELRNRIFYGELVKITPGFRNLIDQNNDVLDLSEILLEKRSIYIHGMIDRAYFQWTKNKLELTLGRQRINWGINTVWNPNDLFNAYSFFDFDYEEKNGSDALRMIYYTGAASSFEVAVKAFEKKDEITAAGLWKFNKWNYDFQILGGLAENDLTFGGGWSGYLKDLGIKGEGTYFHPTENYEDTTGILLISVGLDYLLNDKMNVAVGGLYKNGKDNDPVLILNSTNLSVKDITTTNWSFIAVYSIQLSPRLNGSCYALYTPKNKGLFAGPSLNFSIKDNWDIDAVGQIITNQFGTIDATIDKIISLRLKWSF